MRVAELVDCLGEGSPAEKDIVPRESVGLLSKANERNERTHSGLIRKSEDEVEPRNEEIDVSDAEGFGSPREIGDACEDDFRVVLPPPWIEAFRWKREAFANHHFLPE